MLDLRVKEGKKEKKKERGRLACALLRNTKRPKIEEQERGNKKIFSLFQFEGIEQKLVEF